MLSQKETVTRRIKIRVPSLYPKQHQAIFDPKRHSFIEASTKAGKTHGCLIWQLTQALNTVGHHWWVAPVYGQSRIAFLRAEKLLPSAIVASVNHSEQRISLRNGSEWSFKSGERPDNLYGEDVHSAVIDEASRCKEDVWNAIRSTLTATGGKTRVIGNVRGKKNWFYRLARRAQAGAKNYGYHKLTAYDAVAGGVLPIEEIEEAKEDLSESVFNELYLAEAADLASNPFGMSYIERCAVPVREMSDKPPVCFGIDLAKSVDWAVIIGLDEDGNVCEFHRFQKPWKATIALIVAIVGNNNAMIDCTGAGDPVLEFIQDEGHGNFEGVVFTTKSKQQMMEGLAVDIQREAFTFPDNEIRQELDEFEYEYTRTGVRYSAPEGFNDDCVDGLALARKCYREHGIVAWWM